MIEELAEELVALGIPPGKAARIVTAAFAAGAAANSGGIPVDFVAEKRREWDRNRKRTKQVSGGIPVDSGGIPLSALSLKNLNKKEKKERAGKHPIPVEWQPSEKHFAWAEKEHIPRSAVISKAEDMRLWAQSTGEQKKDWDATLFVWMRRDAAKLRDKPPVKGSGVPLGAGDRSWDLWKSHYRDTGNLQMVRIMEMQAQKGNAITVPSEYPPGHERAA
jgi:hypothetical protein